MKTLVVAMNTIGLLTVAFICGVIAVAKFIVWDMWR